MRCFKSGKRVEEVRLDSIKKNKGLYWVNCSDASERELKIVADKLDISLSCLKHSLDLYESPRFEHIGNCYYIIFKAPLETKYGMTSVPIGIYFTNNVVVTVCSKKIDSIEKFYKEDNLNALLQGDVLSLIGKLLLSMIRFYGKFLDAISDHIDKLEEKVFKNYNIFLVKSIL